MKPLARLPELASARLAWLPQQLDALQVALIVSLGVHAVALFVHFTSPGHAPRAFRDNSLDVILVNAKSDQTPLKATAIAQSSLTGGGESASGRSTTPLPPHALQMRGNAEEHAERQAQALQKQQEQLLAQIKQRLSEMPPLQMQSNDQAKAMQAQEEKRRQLLRLLGEVERRIAQENARPKKRYISPATREAAYAQYYNQLRHKIEERGTLNFPTAAGGQKLYGELTMTITVNEQGEVLATEVVRSSNNPQLDRRAQAIVRHAGPFGAFTTAMRNQAEHLVIVSRFKFTREETLETRVSAP